MSSQVGHERIRKAKSVLTAPRLEKSEHAAEGHREKHAVEQPDRQVLRIVPDARPEVFPELGVKRDPALPGPEEGEDTGCDERLELNVHDPRVDRKPVAKENAWWE